MSWVSSREGHTASEKKDRVQTSDQSIEEPEYRLYKRRFVGLLGLVLLAAISAMPWVWFGPISNNMVEEFGFTLDRVSWLGNIVACIYLPMALAIPAIVSKYGFRRACEFGTLMLLISAWIRYAGTVWALTKEQSYGLLILGQFFAALSQPVFQVLGPKYSESWFDLKGRTTATMIVAIANPVGGAIGQILAPLLGNTRNSILVLGILCTAVTPCVFLIGAAPPTPPTYAGSKPSQSLSPLVKALLGHETTPDAYMTGCERFDFGVVTIIFGALVGATNTFAILSGQIVEPAGYSSSLAGFFGACLLLSGIVAAIVTAPLFDRVFTHHLALITKIMVPIVGVAWLALIWAVKPHDTGGIFAVMAIIGICSVTILPVGLELGVELTRNAEGSSAILWFAGNLTSVVLVLVQGALRAGPDANPPLNMHRALIFNGTFVLICCASVFLLRGKQARRERDVQHQKQFEREHNLVKENVA